MTCHRRTLAGRRDLLAPAASFPQRYPCLLESVVRGNAQSRYDILFAFPGDRLTLHADGRLCDGAGNPRAGRFLDALDAAWQAERLPPDDDELPFHGGWVLLLAYELAGEIEPKLNLRAPAALPVALAMRCPAAAIVEPLADGRVLEQVSLPQMSRGEPIGRVFSFRDLSEKLAAHQRIEELGRSDVLTGAPNRRALADRIDLAVAALER